MPLVSFEFVILPPGRESIVFLTHTHVKTVHLKERNGIMVLKFPSHENSQRTKRTLKK